MADQIDIDDLVRELRTLTQGLGGLGATPTTGGGDMTRGFDRVVAALGKLATQLKGEAKSRSQEEKSLKDFTKSVDAAADAQDEYRKAQEKAAADIEAAAKAARQAAKDAAAAQQTQTAGTKKLTAEDKIRGAADALKQRRADAVKEREITTAGQLVNEYGRGVTGTQALREKFESLGGSSMGLNVAAKLASAGLEGLVSGLAEYGKAIYQGQVGASTAAKGITTFAKTIGTAAQAIGGILLVIPGFQLAGAALLAAGTAAKGFATYTEEAAAQSDRLYGTFQDLSKSGATASDGMTGLGKDAQKLGYGLNEIDLKQFSALIAKSSEDLALFSGSAMKGRRDFASVAEGFARGPVGKGLMNMGMTVDQVNEGFASYLALQSRVGQAQGKTQAQLQAGAAAYLKEMDGLAKLTGIQRAEMEANINKARAVEAFRAKVDAMRASGDANQIKAADEMERYYAVLAKKAPELAQGYAESASGLIASPAGVKFFNTIDRYGNVVRGLNDGTMDATKALGASAQGAQQFKNEMNSVAQAGAIGATGMGNYVEASNLAVLANRDLAKEMQDVKTEQDKQAAGVDAATNAQTEMRLEQMKSRDALQNMVNAGVTPATKALSGFSEALNKITGITKTETQKAAEAAAEKARAEGKGTLGQMWEGTKAGARTFFGGGQPAPAPEAPPPGRPPMAPPPAGGVRPGGRQDIDQNLSDVTEALKKRGMNEAYIKATLGNVMKETGGRRVEENLDYSKTSNERIRQIFGARVAGKTDAELNQLKSTPEGFAEAMYGAGTKIGQGMGNVEPGDGWRFRGRGYIQLTGRNNYAAASKAIFGDDTLLKNPDLVNDPKVAAEVTAWFMEKGQKGMAQRLNIDPSAMSQEQANLLATSVVAGQAIRPGQGYLGGELLSKVGQYAGSGAVQTAAARPPSGGQAVEMAAARPPSGGQAVEMAAAGTGFPMAGKGTARTRGLTIAGESGPEAIIPLPDGKHVPVMLDLKNLISDGIGANYQLGDMKLGGRGFSGDLATMVESLKSSSTSPATALQSTLSGFRDEITKAIQQAASGGGSNMQSLMEEMVSLQRRNASASEKILQASTN